MMLFFTLSKMVLFLNKMSKLWGLSNKQEINVWNQPLKPIPISMTSMTSLTVSMFYADTSEGLKKAPRHSHRQATKTRSTPMSQEYQEVISHQRDSSLIVAVRAPILQVWGKYLWWNLVDRRHLTKCTRTTKSINMNLLWIKKITEVHCQPSGSQEEIHLKMKLNTIMLMKKTLKLMIIPMR
jgi:hypothetical protein